MKYISLLHAIDTLDVEWCYLINTSSFEVFTRLHYVFIYWATSIHISRWNASFCVDVRFVLNSLHFKGWKFVAQ